jgi:phospholipase C
MLIPEKKLLFQVKPGYLVQITAAFILLSLVQPPKLFAPEPMHAYAAKNASHNSHLQVSILSWNIAMLPLLDNVRTGKTRRASGIGRALQTMDYDIIVFQEAFSALARRAISGVLCRDYPFVYGPANSGPAFRFNSGIWVLSRIPLRTIREYKFSGCQGFDCLSRKGAILLEGQSNGQPFQLIGTHLESDESDPSVRIAQLNELHDSIIDPYSLPDIPQIICGDFNTDRDLPEQYGNMLSILNCEDGDLSGEERITFGFLKNPDGGQSHEKPRQLDYILTKNQDLLEMISRKVINITERGSIGNTCLSDHYGIEAIVRFRTVESLTGSQ